MYVNQIENMITFRITAGCYLELLMPDTIKLLGSTKSKITKDENGEKVPHLKITEVLLLHFDIVNNDFQQDSRVFHTFVPNKLFEQLLNISPRNFIYLKTFNTTFSYIELWFTYQNSKIK